MDIINSFNFEIVDEVLDYEPHEGSESDEHTDIEKDGYDDSDEKTILD